MHTWHGSIDAFLFLHQGALFQNLGQRARVGQEADILDPEIARPRDVKARIFLQMGSSQIAVKAHGSITFAVLSDLKQKDSWLKGTQKWIDGYIYVFSVCAKRFFIVLCKSIQFLIIH